LPQRFSPAALGRADERRGHDEGRRALRHRGRGFHIRGDRAAPIPRASPRIRGTDRYRPGIRSIPSGIGSPAFRLVVTAPRIGSIPFEEPIDTVRDRIDRVSCGCDQSRGSDRSVPEFLSQANDFLSIGSSYHRKGAPKPGEGNLEVSAYALRAMARSWILDLRPSTFEHGGRRSRRSLRSERRRTPHRSSRTQRTRADRGEALLERRVRVVVGAVRLGRSRAREVLLVEQHERARQLLAARRLGREPVGR